MRKTKEKKYQNRKEMFIDVHIWMKLFDKFNIYSPVKNERKKEFTFSSQRLYFRLFLFVVWKRSNVLISSINATYPFRRKKRY